MKEKKPISLSPLIHIHLRILQMASRPIVQQEARGIVFLNHCIYFLWWGMPSFLIIVYFFYSVNEINQTNHLNHCIYYYTLFDVMMHVSLNFSFLFSLKIMNLSCLILWGLGSNILLYYWVKTWKILLRTSKSVWIINRL